VSRVRARLVLASASPRRRALLAEAGLDFEVVPPEVDEDVAPGIDPFEAATELAVRKALAVAQRTQAPALLLAADTIVLHAGQSGGGAVPGPVRMLGKPRDEDEARAMLGLLSGSRHAVVTGLCVVRLPDGLLLRDSECTWVSMRVLAPHEIEAYVASGEWRDKAGGYAIQESADRFVTGLEGGGHDNVVGLPVVRALRLLRAAGGA